MGVIPALLTGPALCNRLGVVAGHSKAAVCLVVWLGFGVLVVAARIAFDVARK